MWLLRKLRLRVNFGSAINEVFHMFKCKRRYVPATTIAIKKYVLSPLQTHRRDENVLNDGW